MDDNMDADGQRESPQAAERMRRDTEVFVEANHPSQVLEGLNRQRLNNTLCDVTLSCEGQQFPCHRSVLASFSSYFEAMFTSGMKESTDDRVTMSGVEAQMLGLLVDFAYTYRVSISPDNVQPLLAASDLLDVRAVREACSDYMERHMDVNNCVEMFCCADDHSCEMLEEQSMEYILEHFTEVYQQEEFLSLSVERVTQILASDHLNVPKEDMVFKAAMLWLEKCPSHRQNFDKVLEQIRLPLISPSYLHTVVERLEVVKDQQGCQRFISEAKGEQPYSNTAGPRRTTVFVTVGRGAEKAAAGRSTNKKKKFHKVESFDPLTSQWTTLGRLPQKVEAYAVLMSGSVLYLAGGYRDGSVHNNSKEMWRYDVHRNSWSEMAPMNMARHNFSYNSVSGMSRKLDERLHSAYGQGLVLLDGCVFAVSGSGCESQDSMERYQPVTNTWQLMEDVGVAAYYDSGHRNAVALDGHLYFIGTPRKPALPQVSKFNPETSVWTEVPPMQILRDLPAVCALNGKLYAIGGRNYSNMKSKSAGPHYVFENTVECLDPRADRWTMCSPMLEPRFQPRVTVLHGDIYVLGGIDVNFSRLPNIERYSDETDSWETVGQMTGEYPDAALKSPMALKLRNDRSDDEYDDDDDDDEEERGSDDSFENSD